MLCYLEAMRPALLAAALVSLAGCPQGSSGGGGGECQTDPECGDSEVCARDHMCTSASSVREVTTTWTIRGAEANTTSCAAHPDLFISFIGRDSGDTLGFAPVPCRNGRFPIDKLPERFRQVELGVEGGPFEIQPISAAGTVAIDLR
jgi:hypothetical protein